MTQYSDCHWTSRDGLRLHYRDYAGRDDRPPIVCLHGLTRNARDFAVLAERLAGEWRVICPEMRGRGDSAYARDPATYNPMQYVDDITLLFEELGLARLVAVGTSLGGLMTLVMATTMRERLAGVVLNDIGPVLEPSGFARIQGYVGQARSYPTWMHAARGLEESQGVAFPDYSVSDWLAMARRLMTLSSNGRIVFDYDMRIAEPILAMSVDDVPDLWPGIDAMAGLPVLLLRGALSDILGAGTLAAMQARLPQAEAVTVPRIGHAPTFAESEVNAALDRMLARVA